MKKEKTIYIVSLNGIKNSGGVEKVTFYLHEILKQKFNVKILSKNRLNFGKLNNLIHPFLISIKLFFIPNKIVIGNSWHCFLFPADYSIHHGTSQGIINNTRESNFSLKITARLEKISARKAKKVIAVSENCRQELKDLYKINAEKITVLNNFVDDEYFVPEKVENKDNRDKITVLFSGALCNKKGLSKLLDFSNFLEESNQNIELHIASNYENYVKLFENNKKTKVFTNISFEKMLNFYQSGNVLFFPTLYEGFSMAVLEALSSGLPVVGSKFAVTPELFKYEFCKLINETTTNEEILESIIKLNNNYNDKKQQIHNLIKQDFGKDQYREKLLSLISIE